MSEVLMQALIGAGGMFLSVVFATLVNIFLTKHKQNKQTNSKDNSENIDTDCKVNAKVLKNSPVTVNTDKLIELMVEAEKHENFSSTEKLDFVLTNYQQYCINSNFKFIRELITDAITKLIDMTKEINKRPKDVMSKEAAQSTDNSVDFIKKGIYN